MVKCKDCDKIPVFNLLNEKLGVYCGIIWHLEFQ